MASNNEPSKVVYVGSIPYDQTEEQLLDVFRSVGNVSQIRLVLDRETGKSKGFAFVEYHDIETAASAVRNLNNYQIGNRSLRVDFSHETALGPDPYTKFKDAGGASSAPPKPGKQAAPASSPAGLLPPLPKGKALESGTSSSAESITQTLNGYDQSKLANFLRDLKQVIDQNPDQVRELLDSRPQLAYAAVQSMLVLNVVEPNVVATLVEGASDVSQEPQEPSKQEPQPVEEQTPENKALIQQVMELTEDQIQPLPQEQQDQIRSIQEQVRTGVITL